MVRRPTGIRRTSWLRDPTHVTDKIAKYTGEQFSDFEIVATRRENWRTAEIRVAAVETPLVFVQPGTYEVAPGKQKRAFRRGTVYGVRP
jgi:hypothetical protein